MNNRLRGSRGGKQDQGAAWVDLLPQVSTGKRNWGPKSGRPKNGGSGQAKFAEGGTFEADRKAALKISPAGAASDRLKEADLQKADAPGLT